jgi:hypothetical protein
LTPSPPSVDSADGARSAADSSASGRLVVHGVAALLHVNLVDLAHLLPGDDLELRAWEKQVLSARVFKRVGRRSEYAI